MLVVEQYLNIRLLLKQCPFCLEYLSEKKNKKGENAQKVKKNPSSITYHRLFIALISCYFYSILPETPSWHDYEPLFS